MLLDEQPQALKVAEVARRLQVDPRTVYGMIRRGELHGVKAGRVWRVPVESLAGFLQTAERAAGRDTTGQARLEESPVAGDQDARDQAARVKAIRGKYRHVLSSVDKYLARKHEEIELENRRWASQDR